MNSVLVFFLFSNFYLQNNLSTEHFHKDSLPLNHYQFLGSHNSYRIKNEPLWNELNRWKHPFTKMMVTPSWNYSHLPLDSQLTYFGIRSLELDIYYDPEGGRFYKRKGNKKIKKATESGIEELKKSGMKVLHAPDYDYETHHYLFTDALQTIKNWSDKNPNHEPLFIMVEMKDLQFMKFFFPFKNTKALSFTEKAVNEIDEEIEKVFGKNSDKIFLPDSLRGEFENIKERILKRGWPKLADCRGKIFFILMGAEEGMKNYVKQNPNLSGRKMFVFTNEKDINAAFIKIGNPTKEKEKIKELVKQGFIVRTRSDAGGREARKENYQRSIDAFGSGAQIISTDFYSGNDYFFGKNKKNNFKIVFPENKIYRQNPVIK